MVIARGHVSHLIHQAPLGCQGRIAAHRLFDLLPLRRRESRWAPRDRRALQPWEPSLIEGMDPSSNRFLVPIQSWCDRGTALAIHQEQNAVIPLTQPHIVATA